MDSNPNRDGKDVFISYSHADRAFVEDLARDLRAANVDVWLDQWDIGIGDNIVEKIDEGLSTSALLLLVISTHSLQSTWVQDEWTTRYHDQLQRNEVEILPVCLDTIPEHELPSLLRKRKRLNFEGDYENNLSLLIADIGKKLSTKASDGLHAILRTVWDENKDDIPEMKRREFVKDVSQILDDVKQLLALDADLGPEDRIAFILRELDFHTETQARSLVELDGKLESKPSTFLMGFKDLILRPHQQRYENLAAKIRFIVDNGGDPAESLKNAILELELVRARESQPAREDS